MEYEIKVNKADEEIGINHSIKHTYYAIINIIELRGEE